MSSFVWTIYQVSIIKYLSLFPSPSLSLSLFLSFSLSLFLSFSLSLSLSLSPSLSRALLLFFMYVRRWWCVKIQEWTDFRCALSLSLWVVVMGLLCRIWTDRGESLRKQVCVYAGRRMWGRSWRRTERYLDGKLHGTLFLVLSLKRSLLSVNNVYTWLSEWRKLSCLTTKNITFFLSSVREGFWWSERVGTSK